MLDNVSCFEVDVTHSFG